MRYPLYSYLIGANIAMFFAWRSGIFSQSFLFNNFALSRDNLRRLRLHTLLTYNFSHTTFGHLFSNCLGIYFVGRAVESFFGPRVFLVTFLAGGVIGGLLSLAMQNKFDRRPMIGASAGASSLFGFFVMNFPYERVFIFPIPIPIPAWLLCTVFLFYSYRNSFDYYSNVSHSGHLGGLLTGLFYYFVFHGIVVS